MSTIAERLSDLQAKLDAKRAETNSGVQIISPGKGASLPEKVAISASTTHKSHAIV